MTLSLLGMNVCQYNNCGLHFANLHDLLQHIEETHIGPIEEEMKKKEAMAMNAAGGDESMKSAPVPTAFPLSTDLRLFPVLPEQKAKPIKYEPFRLQFCHYRKKPSTSTGQAVSSQLGDRSSSGHFDQDEESRDSFKNEEVVEDVEQGEEEKRHKCPVEGCNKRYKNLQGVRAHTRQAHGSTDEAVACGAVPFDLTAGVSGQALATVAQSSSSGRSANVRPYKCNQCPKRYKTIAGLNNHIQQGHQRINPTTAATHVSTASPVNSAQMYADAEGMLVVGSSALPTQSAASENQTPTTTTGRGQSTHTSFSTIAAQQNQQQSILANLTLPTSSSGTRNMNVLSAYGPRTSEFQSSAGQVSKS